MLNKELLLASQGEGGALTVCYAPGLYFPVGWDLYVEGYGSITRSDLIIPNAKVDFLYKLAYKRITDFTPDRVNGVFNLTEDSSGVPLVTEDIDGSGDIVYYLKVNAFPAVAYISFN